MDAYGGSGNAAPVQIKERRGGELKDSSLQNN